MGRVKPMHENKKNLKTQALRYLVQLDFSNSNLGGKDRNLCIPHIRNNPNWNLKL